MSDDPGTGGEQGDLVAGLRAVIGAKDEQIAALTASLEAALAALEGERELRRRLELRVAELERRLSMDSTDSGTPSSRERIGAKEARKARQQSERERRKDRKRGGQSGHQGKAWDGTRIRTTRRPRIRRRNAVPAARPWTARMPWSRGGRRSLTWRSSGR